MNTNLITFHSHLNHNPSCDIVCYQLDKDTYVTYGIYVKDYWAGNLRDSKRKTDGFCEVYVGENYNVGSTRRSHSRIFQADKNAMMSTWDSIPKKYKELWIELKIYYNENYKQGTISGPVYVAGERTIN